MASEARTVLKAIRHDFKPDENSSNRDAKVVPTELAVHRPHANSCKRGESREKAGDGSDDDEGGSTVGVTT